MQLDKLVDRAYTITKEHRFLPDRNTPIPPQEYENLILKQIGCLYEEVGELFQELRNGHQLNVVTYRVTDCGQKPEGFPTELADLVIRVMSLSGWMGIPLEQIILEKMAYNEKRPPLHGRSF